MKYLVTGGAGFIGSHLVHYLLASGNEVIVIDDLSTGIQTNLSDKAVFIRGDVADPNFLNSIMNDIDGCFHLAAISSVELCRINPERGSAVNFGGTVKIFENAARLDIPVVYASSAAVYGNSDKPIRNEKDFVKPINNYGADKYLCEIEAKNYNEEKGLRSVGARIFNCYGPRQRADSEYSGVIAKFVNLISENNPVMIYGDGSFTRDFVFVDDVVRFFNVAMQHLQSGKVISEVSNVCTGKQVTILELAQLIAEVINKPLKINFQPGRIADISSSVGAPSYAKEKFGWKYLCDLKAGLIKMINN